MVGECPASSASTVLSNGTLAVLDKTQGGLVTRPPNLSLDVIIDCVGSQDIEAMALMVMPHRGHFVTIMGPGTGAFGDGGDNAKAQVAQGMKIAGRSFKGMFSGTKYTQAAMPITGGPKIIEQMMNENLKSVVDSEVPMLDAEAMIAAVEKVNSHKTRGRLVLVNNNE